MNILYISPAVEKDLIDIKQYISKELDNPVAAKRIVKKIIKHLKHLEKFPEMGTRLSAKILIETDYRFIVCGNYLAFYRLKENIIFIDRVIYGKRDYIKILFGNLNNEKDKAEV